jgi:hypothetical protein
LVLKYCAARAALPSDHLDLVLGPHRHRLGCCDRYNGQSVRKPCPACPGFSCSMVHR